MSSTLSLLIGGEARSSAALFERRDRVAGQVPTTSSAATEADAIAAEDSAQAAFPAVHDEAQKPFCGVKSSGHGRFGSKAGVDAFTELRWITIETQSGHYPI